MRPHTHLTIIDLNILLREDFKRFIYAHDIVLYESAGRAVQRRPQFRAHILLSAWRDRQTDEARYPALHHQVHSTVLVRQASRLVDVRLYARAGLRHRQKPEGMLRRCRPSRGRLQAESLSARRNVSSHSYFVCDGVSVMSALVFGN